MIETEISQLLDTLSKQDLEEVQKYERSRWDELYGNDNKPIIIYGAGQLGLKILHGLLELNIRPLAFTDNNQALWNTSINELPVLSPTEAAVRYGKNAIFIVAIWSPGKARRFINIKESLTNLGCLWVYSFIPLFWKYSDKFLPYYCLDLPHKIIHDFESIKIAFHLFEDEKSRQEFLIRLHLLLTENDFSYDFEDYVDPIYFPKEIYKSEEDETFIDCGAFDGDTIREYLKIYGNQFHSIFAIEPEQKNFAKLLNYVSTLPIDIQKKISVHNLAVGNKEETVKFNASGNVSHIDINGANLIKIIPLDKLLTDKKSTLIKMDIEGSELEAIEGAKLSIQKYQPVLAICVYHRQAHLWKIPLLLNTYVSDYRFFLRRQSNDEFSDLVCFAVPPERFID